MDQHLRDGLQRFCRALGCLGRTLPAGSPVILTLPARCRGAVRRAGVAGAEPNVRLTTGVEDANLPQGGWACKSGGLDDIECMNTSEPSTNAARRSTGWRRIPIAALMALSFGALVFVSVGGVLALSVGANVRNTLDLLGAQSTLLVDAMEDLLRAEMGRAENAVAGVAQLYAQSDFEIDDAKMSAALAGALSATPGANAMLVCTADLKCRGAARGGRDFPANEIRHLPAAPEKSPQVRAALEGRRQLDGRQWGAFVANEYGLFANVSTPLQRDGETRGWVIAAVELRKLSEITRNCRRASVHMPSSWMATELSWQTLA